MNPKELKDFDFSDIHIKQEVESISLEQRHYISSIRNVKDAKPDQEVFATLRGKLFWCTHSSRPDFAYCCAKLSQIRGNEIETQDMKML